MKTTILLILFLFLVSQSSHGQKFNYQHKGFNEPGNRNSRFERTDTLFRLFPHPDLFHWRDHRNSDPAKDKTFRNLVIARSDPSYYFDEEFPGSSKYYAKNPSLLNMPGEGKFILKPDTESKYYLLIKDPKDYFFSGK
jgi:hypothetical protein